MINKTLLLIAYTNLLPLYIYYIQLSIGLTSYHVAAEMHCTKITRLTNQIYLRPCISKRLSDI